MRVAFFYSVSYLPACFCYVKNPACKIQLLALVYR
jgi:hypothetical protein